MGYVLPSSYCIAVILDSKNLKWNAEASFKVCFGKKWT